MTAITLPRRFHQTKAPAAFLAWFVTLLLFCCGAVALIVLIPEPSGTTVYEKGDTVIDASHADQGYVMIRHAKTKKAIKVRITLGNATYTYDLRSDNEYEVFPLQLGDGTYKIQVFKQASGSRYSSEASVSFKVELANVDAPYLYPNQYVNFTRESAAVAKAQELCAGKLRDADKIDAIYQYVISNIVYDHIRALTVEGGYIPDIDSVLSEGKGICFDYAALMASMLRSQGVPTKLVIGYADKIYHAWNDVLIDGEWVRYDSTAAANSMTVKRYTEERVY